MLVIRDGARPETPDDFECPESFLSLIIACWDSDAQIRPTFLDIMAQLSAMFDATEANIVAVPSSHSRLASSIGTSAYTDSMVGHEKMWSATSDAGGFQIVRSDVDLQSPRASSVDHKTSLKSEAVAIPAPPPPTEEGEVIIVFADIAQANLLWEHDPSAMKQANILYNQLLRQELKVYGGYEAAWRLRYGTGPAGMGSFCLAFGNIQSALSWCSAVQHALMEVDWPHDILKHPAADQVLHPSEDRYSPPLSFS